MLHRGLLLCHTADLPTRLQDDNTGGGFNLIFPNYFLVKFNTFVFLDFSLKEIFYLLYLHPIGVSQEQM